MRLDILLLLSTIFLVLAIACHALEDENSATAVARHTAAEENSDAGNQPMTIEEYAFAAEICAWDATLLQKYDAVNAIEAYKRAASVYRHVAVIAHEANMFTEAIDASKREAQLYKLAAQLCREASNIDDEEWLHALAAITSKKVAGVYHDIAIHYSDPNDPIGKASVWLLAANADLESADSFKSVGFLDERMGMYKLAALAFTFAAKIFQAEKNFNQEARAWMQAAEATKLSNLACRLVGNVSNGAKTYAVAADLYAAAAKAYKNADDTESAIKADQQAVEWRTRATEMFHEAYNYEAKNYRNVAKCHLDLNEHAQAGTAFELAGHAFQRAHDYFVAVTMFQEAEMAYTVADDLIAVQRVRRDIVACESMTRKQQPLYQSEQETGDSCLIS